MSETLEPIEPTPKPKKRRKGPHGHPEELKERAMIALAEHNGNSRRAAAMLAKDGIKLSFSCVNEWRHRDPERYERVRAEVLPRVRLKASERHMDLSERLMDAEGVILGKMMERVDELPPKEMSTALRNVSTSSAIHTDKAQVLSDQPTEIRRLDAGEVLRKLGSRNMRLEATERTLAIESSE